MLYPGNTVRALLPRRVDRVRSESSTTLTTVRTGTHGDQELLFDSSNVLPVLVCSRLFILTRSASSGAYHSICIKADHFLSVNQGSYT